MTLPLAGSHYVLNAMAACAVGHSLGPRLPGLAQGLKTWARSTAAARSRAKPGASWWWTTTAITPRRSAPPLPAWPRPFPDRRLVVAFQPHRYSRTRALLPEFFPVFEQAQMVFITEIYGAGESRSNGVSGRSVYEGVRSAGHPGVHFIEENGSKTDYIIDHLNAGDLVLTLGAGDIWKTGEELLARLQSRGGATEARPA